MKRIVLGVFVIGVIAGGIGIAMRSSRSSTPGTPGLEASALDPSRVSRAGIAPVISAFSSQETGFRVAYADSKDPDHDKLRELFVKDRVFENIASSLNAAVAMPRTVDIQLVDCGGPNAFYDPDNHRIIVCYELVSYFLHTFRPHAPESAELGTAAMGATVFAFFHELGHALIHELALPSTGREEDGADQIATLILLEAGDDGVRMALSGAQWFALLAADNQQRTPFWDEHAFDGQRFFNILCLVYGENPEARAGLVGKTLPEDRAKRCAGEFRAINAAWEKLLQPHLRSSTAPGAPATPRSPDSTDGVAPPCEAVAAHAVEVVRREMLGALEAELAKAESADERAALAEVVADRLRTFQATLAERCVVQAWSPAVRTCVHAATSTEAGGRCLP